MTVAEGGRRTLADELRLALADDIVRGLLVPGAALDESELARRFGVSRTPVREAIRQLGASGLVEVRAHRGAVVARPSEERLIGMFEAMAELEALCAGLAAERMTAAERAALEAAHEELRALIHGGDPQRYHEVNEAFAGEVAPRARPRRGRDPARRSRRRRRRHAPPHHDGVRGLRGLRRDGVSDLAQVAPIAVVEFDADRCCGLGALPPPLAAELGFTRVRPLH